MTTPTLHLGTVTITGHARGPLIEVTVGQDNMLTIPEWTSLQSIVDVLAAADGEMARLRAEIAALRNVAEARSSVVRAAEAWQRIESRPPLIKTGTRVESSRVSRDLWDAVAALRKAGQ